MRVLFRTDASEEIATGHVSRCLTLSESLRDRGAEIQFVCRDHPGNLADQIRQHGIPVHLLNPPGPQDATAANGQQYQTWLGASQETDAAETRTVVQELGGADWVIVDHYGIGQSWHRQLRNEALSIAVIDDLADRPYDCDLLLDQNFGRSHADYQSLTPAGAELLLGPKYALLRPEFAEWRETALGRRRENTTPRNILINMGGVDADNVTSLVLEKLAEATFDSSLKITVMLGKYAPYRQQVEETAKSVHLHVDVRSGVTEVARLLTDVDIAIGAAGASSWERCCLGLPSLLFTTADNQHYIAEQLDSAGAGIHVGRPEQVAQNPDRLLEPLRRLLTKADYRNEVSLRASSIVDGNGTARVARAITGGL